MAGRRRINQAVAQPVGVFQQEAKDRADKSCGCPNNGHK